MEVSRLEWGPVKTHEARTVRLPRSVAEGVAASLAGRPQDREALVFTAPRDGPLSRADFVKFVFRPAVRAANEAMVRLPKDQRPTLLPDGLRFYDLRHTCASLLIAQGASVKAVQAQLGHATASITPTLRAPVPVRDGHLRGPPGAGPGAAGARRERPSTDQRRPPGRDRRWVTRCCGGG